MAGITSMVFVAAPRAAPVLTKSAAEARRSQMHLLLARTPSGIGHGIGAAAGIGSRRLPVSFAQGGAVGDQFVMERATNTKFPQESTVPGYPERLTILGTGYREKLFVKVYAAALYVDYSISAHIEKWKNEFGIETFEASSFFNSMFKAPVAKSLHIFLVRDVHGNTFAKALDDVITRRIKNPTADDESALSAFRNTFLGRNLKQGTSIYLTWIEPSKLLISVSANQAPSQVDAEIKSLNVTSALYDGFFGDSPVSPALKSSAAQGLEKLFSQQ